MAQRGWQVEITLDSIQATKDGLTLSGDVNRQNSPPSVQFALGPQQAGPSFDAQTVEVDAEFRQTLAWFLDSPGVTIRSRERVQDFNIFDVVLDAEQLGALIEGLGQRGWTVEMTDDFIRGSKGDLTLSGERDPESGEVSLTVGRSLALAPTTITGGNTVDSAFSEAISWFLSRPGVETISHQRVEDFNSFQFNLDANQLGDLIKGLGERGWTVEMTDDFISGSKGDLTLSGERDPESGNVSLTVGRSLALAPTTTTGGDTVDNQFRQAISWFLNSPGVEATSHQRVEDFNTFTFDLDARQLGDLISGLGERGWVVEMTDDFISGSKGDLTLSGERNPENGTVALTVGRSVNAASPDLDGAFNSAVDWIANLQDVAVLSQERLVDYNQFVFDLDGNQDKILFDIFQGLASRGWVVELTEGGISASKDGMSLEGLASDGQLALSVGNRQQPDSNVDGDIQGQLAWLLALPDLKIDQQERLVDFNRLVIAGGPQQLSKLRQEFANRGFKFDGNRATKDGLYLQLSNNGSQVIVEIGRSTP